MKRIVIVALSVLIVATLILGASIAMAAKPQHAGHNDINVIERSNGFPSGPHFNLNIHGKKANFDCNSTEGGGSVFVLEYGDSTIQYISNKKASVTELKVLDPCAGFDGDPALVQLPKAAEGYYVFARILGKPNNGDSGPSIMILEPNVVVQACNDPGTDPDFPDYTDCLLSLGLIVGNNLYTAGNETFERFESQDPPKKGKSKARDITPLFTYTGWVYWGEDPDTNEDGSLTDADIPVDWETSYPNADLNGDVTLDLCEWVLYHPDINGDEAVDETDATLAQDYEPCSGTTVGDGSDPITLEEWQAFQESLGHAAYFDEEWIFNIADLVVTQQGITNDGTKLLQVRFYPVATTEFNS